MSNVTECINLYLADECVTDKQFRAMIADAAARDQIEANARQTYWDNLREARKEREGMETA